MSSGASTPGPLFVDTWAFVAWFDGDDGDHDRVKDLFSEIREGRRFRSLFTSRYILSETATLLRYNASDGHTKAVRALREIRDADSFHILQADESVFDETCERFERYDDQVISFVDHLSGALCNEHDIDHVLTNDSGDFETMGLATVS